MKQPKKLKEAGAVQGQAARIYRLRVSLRYTDPLVWRRVEVPAEIKIDRLTRVILALFGWDGDHLSQLDIKGKCYNDETNWEEEDQPIWEKAQHIERLLQARSLPPMDRARALIEAARMQKPAESRSRGVPALSDLVTRVRTKFTLTYDFGDDWKHIIEVEKIAPPEPDVHYPRCTDGARANPIEDCGGPYGFSELVEAAGNPNHPRFADLEEWGMEKWDPAAFSIEALNRKLAKY